MMKITHVWIDPANSKLNGNGTYFGADFENGHTILISLYEKRGDPLFDEILLEQCDTEPKTDGGRVYWENGASLTVDDIVAMLRTENGSKKQVGGY